MSLFYLNKKNIPMKIFLRMKHWQLFILLFGIPFTFQGIGMVSIAFFKDPAMLFLVFPLILLLYMAGFFSWFYTLGTNLNRRLPDTVQMNLRKFKILLSIPIVYILLICIFLFGLFKNLAEMAASGSTDLAAFSALQPSWALVALIIPLHFFSIFCIFYSLYFIAKSLKVAEGQRAVVFNDFAGEFFLIWFFPIGVWILQPRINRLFANDRENRNNNRID
jgi:hypothetical protein